MFFTLLINMAAKTEKICGDETGANTEQLVNNESFGSYFQAIWGAKIAYLGQKSVWKKKYIYQRDETGAYAEHLVNNESFGSCCQAKTV